MADHYRILKMEKEALLADWFRALQSEKAEIMVRIMDIEEQIEAWERQMEETNKKIG